MHANPTPIHTNQSQSGMKLPTCGAGDLNFTRNTKSNRHERSAGQAHSKAHNFFTHTEGTQSRTSNEETAGLQICRLCQLASGQLHQLPHAPQALLAGTRDSHRCQTAGRTRTKRVSAPAKAALLRLLTAKVHSPSFSWLISAKQSLMLTNCSLRIALYISCVFLSFQSSLHSSAQSEFLSPSIEPSDSVSSCLSSRSVSLSINFIT